MFSPYSFSVVWFLPVVLDGASSFPLLLSFGVFSVVLFVIFLLSFGSFFSLPLFLVIFILLGWFFSLIFLFSCGESLNVKGAVSFGFGVFIVSEICFFLSFF